MKKLLATLILLTIFSCKTPVKKEIKEHKEPVKNETREKVVVKKKAEKVDNTLISLQKKPCSGDCPVFKVNITKDGFLTYHGIQYTNIEGKHTLQLSSKQQAKLTKILAASNFSELESKYATSGTKDFAETILTYQNKSVVVRLWKDAPENLTNLYVFIEDILYDQKYLE